MIKYRLVCDKQHEFDGWFDTISGFEKQSDMGALSCPICASTQVRRGIMAPNVPAKSNRKLGSHAPDPAANLAPDDMLNMLHKISRHVEQTHDYVGDQFADEARAIHYGESEQRDIYGETSLTQAAELLEEGVSVLPLPMVPSKDKN